MPAGPAPGIIPARAGFTVVRGERIPGPGDHPRSRGVYCMQSMMLMVDSGSSPLARGLRSEEASAVLVARIIPARAGFTACARARGSNRWDHPRSRGVYGGVLSVRGGYQGSSPLARGLRVDVDVVHDAVRIIPARAGFTVLHGRRVPHPGDHPRSRGVYMRVTPNVSRLGGSSPLARGLRCDVRRTQLIPGIIPARAGFTFRQLTTH